MTRIISFRIILFTIVFVFFISCKKDNGISNNSSVSIDLIASQIISSFISSTNGTLGGINLLNGVHLGTGSLGLNKNRSKANSNIGFEFPKGHRIGSLGSGSSTICGELVDTLYSFDSPTEDTTEISLNSHLQYTQTCNGSISAGFNISDTINYIWNTPSYNSNGKIAYSVNLNSTNANDPLAELTSKVIMNM